MNLNNYPKCPRSNCHLPMVLVEFTEDKDTMKYVYECPHHNNKNNPAMKLLLDLFDK